MDTGEKYKRQPFISAPLAEAYFPASAIETARSSVFRCLNRNEGIAVIFGGTGLGKTMLLRVLAEEFQQNDLVVLSPARLKSVKAFYQQLLLGFHQTWCGCDENECRLFTIDYLQKNAAVKVILLLDEAQSLAWSIFEELRILLDICDKDRVRCSVALAGSMRLEERLTSPRLAAFGQRIVCRTWLDPFDTNETGQYIDKSLDMAGIPLSMIRFESDAKKLVHKLSQGVPRLVNQICNTLVYSIFNGDSSIGKDLRNAVDQEQFFKVTAEQVARAWGKIQQISPDSILPVSNSNPPDSANHPTMESSSVVEFGSLDDEEEEYETCAVEYGANDSSDDAQSELEFDLMIRRNVLGDADLPQNEESQEPILPYSEAERYEHPGTEESFDEDEIESVESLSPVEHSPEWNEFRHDMPHEFPSDLESTGEEYLKELQDLEGEIELENRVIGQIKDIQQDMRRLYCANGHRVPARSDKLGTLQFPESGEKTPEKDRMAKNAERLASQKEEEPPEPHFRSVFQQIYTKEKEE